MAEFQRILKTCKKGHQYYKSSDCPTCPICENEQKPKDGFLARLSAPARRALENNGIQTLQKLASYTEKEILDLHGMGKASLAMLNKLLATEGLTFKQ
jgi:DNA-directed RNA polymerase alpha subunit